MSRGEEFEGAAAAAVRDRLPDGGRAEAEDAVQDA